MLNDKTILNILVTGANGQLGRTIQEIVLNSHDNYYFTDIDTLDITDEKAVNEYITKNSIHVIINCAAYTNVDEAENNEKLAYLINAEGPEILAKEIKKHKGTLIHISTDYVFGGVNINIPINENLKPNPLGIYGMTKLKGEKLIENSGVSKIIFRTSWLYSNYGNNFVEKILNLLKDRDLIKVVFDQCGTPTYAADLAKAIVEIINERKLNKFEGIYHFSNDGVCSWYDFAHEIANISGLKDKTIIPCHSSEYISKVVRPSFSVLDNTKYKITFGKTIPYWRDSLYRMLHKTKI